MTKVKEEGIQKNLAQENSKCREANQVIRKSLGEQLVEWVDNIMPSRF